MPQRLPVLDLRAADGDPATREQFHRELREAAHDVGFFQLVGHGISPARIAELLTATHAFFALPQNSRNAISNLNSPHFRGYTRVGDERTGGRADRREQLDVAVERAASPPDPGEPRYRWLHGPNLWPADLPELKAVVLRWIADLSVVAHRLLRELLTALGAPADAFDDAFAEAPHVHLKLIRYPGLARGGDEQGADEPGADEQGVGTHKDYGFLTLLLQDRLGGLQVHGADGTFTDVPVLADAFVINLGEMLELATRGRLVATSHRVVSPPEGTERFSVGVFYNPRLDYRVQPLPLEPVAGATGIVEDPDNPLLDVYGDNALKGWLRAHPEVARRHHDRARQPT